MKKFWNWTEQDGERILHLNGTIAEESWYDDDVTPAMFQMELMDASGPVTIWLNSPGGDCIAASRIYSMLRDYRGGTITVKIDGIAASAASVIAMAGDKVLMAPTALLMLHNPAMLAYGDYTDMQKAMEILDEVKQSIVNAYELKTGMDRKAPAKLMDEESWLNAYKAIELGFADGILEREQHADQNESPADQKNESGKPMLFSQRRIDAALMNKLKVPGVPVQPLYDRLEKLKAVSV